MSYRRDSFTWTAFGALFAFGYLNALLGPSLPYLRSAEGIPYLVGALHQVAFALGGGLAGAIAARDRVTLGRQAVIAGGLMGAALAGLAVGYGGIAPITIAAAFLMGLLATLALIRVWAALADAHGPRRAVAMTEGEVAVSLAGIATPLLIGALAAGAATWRLAFAIGTVAAGLAAAGVLRADVPAPRTATRERSGRGRAQPTLVIIFAIVALEFALSFWLASYLNDDVGLARGTAVAMVSGLYAANLLGRLGASRLARTQTPERLLAAALTVILIGLPFLLAATSVAAAVAGIVLAGAGIGALFPLTSSLHIQASGRTADGALGETLIVAALGQTTGPLVAGGIAQVATLRTGLLVLPALTLLAATSLAVHRYRSAPSRPRTTAGRAADRPFST
ncbi:MAG TPA: MFS transporter [Solirubrobacteraceae bacterium]|jgi:MFS family permease